MRRRASVSLAAVAVALAGARVRGASAGDVVRRAQAANPSVVLTPITNGLSGITAITNAGDARLFLTLQVGRIVIWDGAAIRTTPFLDLTSLILSGGERGLLSTAFHPNYAANGLFFVYYTDRQGNLVIARYRRSASDPNAADPSTGVTVLHIDHPVNANHNGGQLQFGPDGFLYIGTGDGGAAFDPPCNAQRNDVLLGKLLRIDVNQSLDAPPYHGIPPDNPFVSTTGPPEAWAKGLRNPWRFSFDRLTHDLVIGDVGQGSREEVDFQPAGSAGGQNYGWKIMEGTLCTDDSGNCPSDVPPCDDASFTPPVLDYDHGSGRCSITGGYVYRGLAIPDLYGMYVYGDFCAGTIWAAVPHGTTWTPVTLPIQTGSLTTFGEDVHGEIYVGTGNGELFLIQTTAVPVPVVETIQPPEGFERGGEAVQITGANFTSQTQVAFGSTQALVHVLSPTLLEAIAPVHSAGVVDITVQNPGATPTVKAAAYTYVVLEHADATEPATRVVVRP